MENIRNSKEMAALSLQRFSHVAQLSLGTEAGRSLIETVEAKPNWKAVGYSIIVKQELKRDYEEATLGLSSFKILS